MSDVFATTFGGLEIIESLAMTEAGEPVTMRRSWRERLCSRPWRPWVATRIVIPQVPRRDVIVIGGRKALMHPETVRRFREAVAKDRMATRSPIGPPKSKKSTA